MYYQQSYDCLPENLKTQQEDCGGREHSDSHP
jgi:hypothetical protein